MIDSSWGFRERPAQTVSTAGEYIATSIALWSGGSSPAPALNAFETQLVASLLNWPANLNPPKYDPASLSNASEMTVLAVLAHEFGHVYWYDTFRPTAGGPHDFSRFCRGTFFGNSWQSVDPPPEWRVFAERQNEHRYDVGAQRLLEAVNTGHFNEAALLLRRIYERPGHWASLFATFSPDEDFVETFKFHVLTSAINNSALTSLPFNIYLPNVTTPVYAENIAANFSSGQKPELRRKVNCF